MSRSDWLKHPKTRLIAGLLVAVAFCSGWIGYGLLQSAEYEREARANTKEYARYTSSQITQACLPLARVEKIDCLYNARNAQREQRYNQQDLVAQRQSALWAYVMAAAAVIGMGLSVIGVWLVWTTFRETKRSADAAFLSVAETRRIGEAQTRCYLAVTGARIKIYEGAVPQILINVRNSGNSPALMVIPAYQIRYLDYLHDTNHPLSELVAHEDTFEISAGEELEIPAFPLADNFNEEILEAFEQRDGSLVIKLVFSMKWDDVFGIADANLWNWTGWASGFKGAVLVMQRHSEVAALARAELANREHKEAQEAKAKTDIT